MCVSSQDFHEPFLLRPQSAAFSCCIIKSVFLFFCIVCRWKVEVARLSIELNVPQTNHREAEKDRDAATGTRDGLFVHALIFFCICARLFVLEEVVLHLWFGTWDFFRQIGSMLSGGAFFLKIRWNIPRANSFFNRLLSPKVSIAQQGRAPLFRDFPTFSTGLIFREGNRRSMQPINH